MKNQIYSFLICCLAFAIFPSSKIYSQEFQKFLSNSEFNDSIPNDSSISKILLNEIEISSSGWKSDVLTSSLVISDKEIIQHTSEKDIPYLLLAHPSAQIQSEAGNGIGYTGFRIRGIDPNQVQISLNGVPLNDSESSRTYFVNTPDILANTDKMNIVTGYVPGRAGTGAFGSAIDLYLNKFNPDPSIGVKNIFGSFNSHIWNVQLNSGLLSKKFFVEARYSNQKSDGYIERASSKLNGLFLSGGIIRNKSMLRVNFIRGTERTGLAWYGLPYRYFQVDSLVTYNYAGREKPGNPYPDEVDQYTQTHSQLFYNLALNQKMSWNTTLHYTNGYGYYENYKANQNLADYLLMHATLQSSDLIRQKWLDNDFYYAYSGLEFQISPELEFSTGVSSSIYKGKHFGKVKWVPSEEITGLNQMYYYNTGSKYENALFLKGNYNFNPKWQWITDFHFRKIDYKIDGKVDFYGNTNILRNFHLFNPKTALIYHFSKPLLFTTSISYYQREPYREDLLTDPNLKKEKLLDFELGVNYSKNSYTLRLNSYFMRYFDYFALNGALNATGDPLRTQISGASRIGLESSIDVKFWKAITLYSLISVSNNKTSEFEEVIPHFGEVFRPEQKNLVSNRSLAFSPEFLASFGIEANLKSWNTFLPITISYVHRIVSSQYLDLSQSSSSLLSSYDLGQFRMSTDLNIGKLKINAFFQCYNLWNNLYSTHGWTLRYTLDQAPNTLDPYSGHVGDDLYFSKGLYPQAGRHYSVGINLKI